MDRLLRRPRRAVPVQYERYFVANDVFTTRIYQLVERYWLFQSIEAALFLAAAAGLIGLTVRIMKRRPAQRLNTAPISGWC